MLEQPSTSLMLLYGGVAELIAKEATFVAVVDVCMFGAPWKKPTSLAANFDSIMNLVRRCDGRHSHISLQGMAPCGKSWTAIASPYWPEFAREWVRQCAHLFLDSNDERLPPLHFAGFPYVDPDVTVESLLRDMGFEVPKKGDIEVVATRVTAGVQPTGRTVPQIIPDGLGPDDHLLVARKLVHPMARPPTVPGYVRSAVEAQNSLKSDLTGARSRMLSEVQRLAVACEPENQQILQCVHPYIRPVVAKRNVAFMREVLHICHGLDNNLVLDYVFGLPMMGWARHSPVLLQRASDPPRAEQPTEEQRLAENAIALTRAKPTADPKLDALAWEKTRKEFENASMLGPFYSLNDLPSGKPRLLNRFGILSNTVVQRKHVIGL